jgi:hypothetical protein
MREFFDSNEYEEDSDFNEESQSDLRLENELRKIKLTLEHGAKFPESEGSDLPPEIEGQFLDYIQQFEKEFARKKMILVYDLAGQPDYVPVAMLADDIVETELTKLMDILSKHSISVDTICEVDKRELYRFITEELFKVETNDIRIPGMIHGFIYEEYHPNHKHDIQNRCGEFVRQILDLEKELRPDFLSLSDEIDLAGKSVTKEEFVKKVGFFRDAFASFTIDELEMLDVTLSDDDKSGKATCHIRYTAALDGSYDTMSFEGLCSFTVAHETELWLISHVNIPGIATA